jgi:predicted transcriptional regulator
MKVIDIMTRGIEGIQASDMVQHAAVRMKDLDIGCLAVFDHDRLVGMITDRDLVVRAMATSLNPAHSSIGEIMSKDPVVCDQDCDVTEAIKRMENHKVRRILAMNSAGQVTGILTFNDAVMKSSAKSELGIERKIKQRTGPRRKETPLSKLRNAA